MITASTSCLLVGLAANAAAGEVAGWISGGVVTGLIFFVVVALPSLFLGGLSETFKSTVWTLTYRELRVLDGVAAAAEDSEPDPLPEEGEKEPLPSPDELDPDNL